jgi:filamentous hemagglutinin family protein
MNQHEQYKLQRKLIVATIAACFGVAQASPVNPQVVAGQASFSQQGNVFSITNAPNTIINWQSFSVGKNEITRFIQQNADSKVLNRITGQDPSQILGSLQSNGKVFLINPNGVLFGKDARIDVNGLVASSLGLSNADFLAGKNNFKAEGLAGKVENQGRITTPQGGQIYLIAPDVENNGIITSPKGDIILAAGRSVQLVDSANPSVQVVVSAPEDQVLNLGQVVAQGGRIGIYGALVNQRGSVNADSAVVGENGKIVLKASSRTTLGAGSVTSARGAGKGGDIEILGKEVALTDNARVDASGQQGGGSVLIGGDYQGANASVQNAAQTYVGKDAVVSVDAADNGDGGKVIVWGNDAAAVYGSITARGGAKGGNGGFIETSAHSLDVAAIHVDAGAAKGKHGTWLIDPYDLEVNATGSAGLLDLLGFLGLPILPTKIGVSLINSATADVQLQAKHDLSINTAISVGAAGVGVSAQAGNNINVNSAITTNGGKISLSANDAAAGASGTGTVTVKAALNAGSGDIALSGKTVNLNSGAVRGYNVALNANKIQVGSSATVTSTGDMLSLVGNDLTINGKLTAAHEVALLGTSAIDTSTEIAADTLYVVGSKINLSKANVNKVAAKSTGDITLTSSKDLQLATSSPEASELGVDFHGITSGGNVTLNAKSISQDFDAPVSAAGKLTLQTSGSVNLADSYDNHVGTLVANNVGNFHYQDSGALNVDSVTLSSNAGDAGINIDAGALTVKTIDGRNAGVHLSGNSLTLGSNASVKAGSVDLTARDGVLKLDTGAKVEGNWIGFTSDSIDLKGTVKSTATNADNGGVTFRTANGRDIKLGGTDTADTGALTLNNAELRNITAYTIFVDNGGYGYAAAAGYGNYGGGYGGAVMIDSLDLTGGKLSGVLSVNARDGIQLANTVKLPNAALNLNTDSALSTTNAAISAKSLTMTAHDITLSSTGSINVGAGNVEIYSRGAVGMGGSTHSGDSYFSNDALKGITAGKLSVRSDSLIAVTGEVNTPTLSYDLEAQGGLTIGDSFTGNFVQLTGDVISVPGVLTASLASMRPYTSSYDITVGGTCASTCLALTQLNNVHAKTIGIGSSDGNFTGSIMVAGISGLDAATKRIGLLAANGGITQSGAINVQELGIETAGDAFLDGALNHVDKLAATSGGHLRFRNDQSLAVAHFTGTRPSGEVLYDLNGISAAHEMTLDVGGSLTREDGVIAADLLTLRATGSIGAADNALLTKANELSAETSATSGNAPIVITNNSAGYSNALTIKSLRIAAGNGGAITVDNYGATTIDAAALVTTDNGNISITAHSPLTVLGQVLSNSGSIFLEAGSTGSSNDDLVIGSSAIVKTLLGNVRLTAGDEVTRLTNSQVLAPGGSITINNEINAPVEPPPVTTPPVEPPVTTPPVTTPPVTTPPVEPPVTTPPVTTPPVTTPPVTTPPVEPPPVTTPPVTTPPVTTPPVTTPPVTTPPVTTPPVTTPPVTTPPTVDVCQVNPALPACQVIQPPSVSEPTKPVQVALNQIISTVKSSSDASPAPSSTASGGGVGNSTSSSKSDEKKSDEKKPEDKQQTSAKQNEPKNEPAKKTYCN